MDTATDATAIENQRLEIALEGAALGSWDWWLADNRVIFDRRWCEMLGLDVNTVEHRLETWDGLCHPDDKAQAYIDIQDHLEGRTPHYENIHRLKHADGSWVWILDRGRISERDENGKPTRFSGTHFNLTKQKLIEEELRNTRICVAGLDGTLRRVNPSFMRVLGFTEAEFLANSFLSFVHPEDLSSTLGEIEKLTHGYTTLQFENRYRTQRGEYRVLNWASVPDPNAGTIYAIARDVTEARKIESELTQTLGAIKTSAIVAITDRAGLITEVNDRFCAISGYSREELLGKNHRILNSGTHEASFFEELWRTISAGGNWTGEIQNRRKNGELYWVQTVITPLLTANDEIERFLSIRFDITERKRAELKLLESSKMASLGEMAGGVAHEINNPLAVILGKASQIKRALEKGVIDHAKLMVDLDKIEKTAERIAKIVSGLRSFSRNADQDPMSPVSVEQVVGDTLELCRERFKTHGIELRVPELGELGSINCRSAQISQVLMNLLSNAYDAVEQLPERWVELSARRVGGLIQLAVTDSGHGIPAEVVQKMMRPFFTTKGVGKGTGLGLSISQGIVADHGGRLIYDSSATNTRFVLELPVGATQPHSGSSAAS